MSTFIDSLIERFKPDETFTIEITSDCALTFRSVTDYAEFVKLQKEGELFVKMCRNQAPQDWLPYLPLPDEALSQVFAVHKLSVEPRLEVVDVLKLTKNLAALFQVLAVKVSAGSSIKLAEVEAEAVIEGKAGTEPTPTPDSVTPAP